MGTLLLSNDWYLKRMKSWLRNIVLLIAPLVLIILVNETMGAAMRGTPSTSECSWACHDQTAHCKTHHVKLLRNQFGWTDSLYDGVIGAFASTGAYQLLMVLLLGFGWPLLIYFLIARSLRLSSEIKKLEESR